jgi:hypothetical protein
MGSNYLDGIEDGYGLSLPLAPGLGELASAIVDSYLMRPEGLVYVQDGNAGDHPLGGMLFHLDLPLHHKPAGAALGLDLGALHGARAVFRLGLRKTRLGEEHAICPSRADF